MPNFALYENDEILNIIVAESKEIAESLTNLHAIEITDTIGIGWKLVNDEWVQPLPEPTIPDYPQDGNVYVWNGETESWKLAEETN